MKRLKKYTRSSQRTLLLFLVVIFAWVNVEIVPSRVRADDASDVQDSMDKVQDKIDDVQKQLDASQAQYNANQSQIYTTQSLIQKTSSDISRTEDEIKNLEQRITLNHEVLSAYLQEMYYNDQDSVSGLTLNEQSFDQYFGNFDQILNAKEKVLSLIQEIKKDQGDLGDTKSQLEDKKADHEKLLSIKQMEQAEVAADIQDAKTTLSQLQDKLNKLRSRYSEILGKSVSTDDILKAAKFAAGATGMSKAFLLGVLIQESNKGQSTGTCNYKESKMSSTQLKAFKSICSDLDYNYTKQKVSCPPKSYSGTGGAMGVPQFMPTTWQAWESEISSATGHKVPDPWNLVDGVTAMALKLSADGASKKTRFYEAKSYCVYLAGGNWGYYCYGSASKYKDSYDDVNCWGSSIKNYGEKVLCLKDNYEKYY